MLNLSNFQSLCIFVITAAKPHHVSNCIDKLRCPDGCGDSKSSTNMTSPESFCWKATAEVQQNCLQKQGQIL